MAGPAAAPVATRRARTVVSGPQRRLDPSDGDTGVPATAVVSRSDRSRAGDRSESDTTVVATTVV
jgi:hypothetical protein